MSGFKTLGLSPQLCDKLCNIGITIPTAIQRLVIPRALEGDADLLILSKTGTGKSLAYLLPTIERSIVQQKRTLILLPTRELAQQVSNLCNSLCAGGPLRMATIFGGVDYQPQRDALGAHPHLIIATPGRLMDLMARGEANIENIDIFIIDEVDQMLDMGFRDAIISMSKLRKEPSQSIAISATMPKALEATLREIAPEVETITIESKSKTVEEIEQLGYFVERDMMNPLLLHIMREQRPSRTIIFTRSRKMAERINEILLDNDIPAEAMHSERGQVAREHIISRFRSGETNTIVATDLISRGVDIPGVTHVINYGLPQSPDQYIHRIGRSARAGQRGVAITLCIPEDKELLDNTCRITKRHIEMSVNHPYVTQHVTKLLSESEKGKKRR